MLPISNIQSFIFLYLVGLLLLHACHSNESTSTDQRQVFHYNQINNITSLDPAFARSQTNIWAVHHLYNGLVQLDEQLNIQPCIAKDWKISDDGRVYTFFLREDVYFHDDAVFPEGKGRRVVAEDVRYSLNRIIDEQVASPGSWIFSGRLDSLQAFEVVDDTTFVLRLSSAFRPMMGILTMQYCSIVAKEAVEQYKRDYRSHPVGTGPFQLKRWLENQALFLLKNEKYFERENEERLPYLDGIRISFMTDRKTAYLELINGKLDFVSGLESSVVNELLTPMGKLQAKQKDRLQFLKSPYLNTEYLGINLDWEEKDHPLLIK
ncbi:MAG: ABC transporter substrate-binding protein, partial [Bacteroidota bacterium]